MGAGAAVVAITGGSAGADGAALNVGAGAQGGDAAALDAAGGAAPGCSDGLEDGELAPNTEREIDHKVSSIFFCMFSFTSVGCFIEFITDLKTLLVISNTFSGRMATGD